MSPLAATVAPEPTPAPDSARPLMVLDAPSVILAARGAVRVETYQRRCVVPVGHIACLRPGLEHRVSAVVPARALRLTLPVDEASHVVNLMDAQPRVHRAPAVLVELLKDADTWRERPPVEQVIQGWTTAVCGLIPRWCGPIVELALLRGESDELRAALAHLLSRLDRPVGLPDAARAAGVSQRTIQRRCASELDMPLSGWLTRARILHAIELLTQHEVAVGEVAAKSGYQSAAAFTRAFSQLLGSTPSAWRPRP